MAVDFIWTVLQVSFTTSAVIGGLLLFVPLLRKRYAAKWRYYVWLLIGLRLLVPITLSLPQAPVQIPVPETFVQQSPLVPDDNPVVTLPGNMEPGGEAKPEMQAAVPERKVGAFTLTPAHLVSGIWLVGAAGSLLIQGVGYARFKRKIKYSPRQPVPVWVETLWRECGEDLGTSRMPGLCISGAAPSPILTGIIKPVLLLPHDRYTHQELALIFRHELVHHRRGDMWYKLALTLASCIHWFNPFVYLMTVQASRDIELSCDDRVMAGLGPDDRGIYGEAILRALPIQSHWRSEPLFSTSFGSTKTSMKQRIRNLFDTSAKKRGIAALCIILLLIGVAGGLVACSPSPQESEANTDPGSEAGSRSGTDSGPDTEHPYMAYESYGIRYDYDGDRLFYNNNLIRYFEDNSLIYKGDGTVSGAFVAHYPGGDGGTIDVYAVRDTEMKLTGVRIADEDEYAGNTLSGRSMRETVAPYEPLGLSADEVGTMFFEGHPVRELKDDTTGELITNSLGVGYPEGAIDLEAVYENGSLSALRPVSQEVFDARTAQRILNAEDYWASEQAERGVTNPDAEAQTISISDVEIRTYSQGDLYVYNILSNNTDKTIASYEKGMLAYDEEGRPLELEWNVLSDTGASYYFLYDWVDGIDMSPGSRADGGGGWSLTVSLDVNDPQPEYENALRVKYVLYNLKQVTFDDGTIWTNPDFNDWRETYEGKTIDIDVLEGYYPLTLMIE